MIATNARYDPAIQDIKKNLTPYQGLIKEHCSEHTYTLISIDLNETVKIKK
jgi:hypothetical protein